MTYGHVFKVWPADPSRCVCGFRRVEHPLRPEPAQAVATAANYEVSILLPTVTSAADTVVTTDG